MTLAKRVFKGSSTILVFSLLTAPFGYLIRILYAHTLTIESFGLFYAVFALINIFTSYNDLGFGSSLAYYTPKFLKKSDYTNVWNSYKYSQIITLLVSVVISIILFFSAGWLSANYFKDPLAKNLVYILIIFLLTHGFITITSNLFIGLQKEIYYSSKELIRLFFTLLFSVIFWMFDLSNVIFYAVAWSLAHVLTATIFYYLLYKKNVHLMSTFNWDKELFKKLFKYALPSVLITSIYTLIISTDIFFLTALRGIKEVGVYNIALPIVFIPTALLIPVSSLFLPLTSSLMEESKEKVLKIIELILVYIPFVVFYFMLFVFIFPAASINFLFGSKWVELTKNPLMILAVGTVFSNLAYYLAIVALGMGFVKERLKISMILALLNILISSILVYMFGVMGAATGYLTIYILSIYFYGRLIQSDVSFKYPLNFYAKLIIFGILAYFISHELDFRITNGLMFIFTGFIYTIILIGFAYLLKLFDKKMIKLLLQKK